jgi:hypothetical protein
MMRVLVSIGVLRFKVLGSRFKGLGARHEISVVLTGTLHLEP